MKTLIAYFTRTNTTKKVVPVLVQKMGADTEELKDKKDRSGAKGYSIACMDVLRKKMTEIEECDYNPSEYDLVIIGTPVWVGTMAPATRTYIALNKDKFKNVAFFTTQGSDKRQRIFDELKKEIGKSPVAELQLTTKEVVSDNFEKKVNEFVERIIS